MDQFEVIVINDGSTDGTAQVLADLETLYAPALRVITAPWGALSPWRRRWPFEKTRLPSPNGG